jgi:hypothetical protein
MRAHGTATRCASQGSPEVDVAIHAIREAARAVALESGVDRFCRSPRKISQPARREKREDDRRIPAWVECCPRPSRRANARLPMIDAASRPAATARYFARLIWPICA